jgi:cell division protein FtsI/penicillin-binding protein 2
MYETRLARVFTLFGLCLGALAVRAFAVQVAGRERILKEHENRVHGRFVVAPRRGDIRWADGSPIASDTPGWSVQIDVDAFFAPRWRCGVCSAVTRRNDEPSRCPECGAEHAAVAVAPPDGAELARLCGVTEKELGDALTAADAEHVAHPEFGRHELFQRVDRDAAVAVALAARRFPGVTVKARALRDVDPAARLLVGTLRDPSREDAEELTSPARTALGLRPYSFAEVYALRFGRSGLEAAFDDRLRGEPGVSRRAARKDGRPQPPAVVVSVADGAPLATTLRRDVQLAAEDVVASEPEASAAAAVVVDLSDGAVVALSARSNDGLHHAVCAIRPGSVFKIVTALALLESGISPDEAVACAGKHPADGQYKCDDDHGAVSFRDAFAKSCNTYFAKMAERVGVDAMQRAYRELGFDDDHWLHLRGSPSGLDPQWDGGSRWHDADLAKIGIGQGKALVSPLQVAIAYARVAAGGRRLTPYVVGDEAPPAAETIPSIAQIAPLLRDAARRVVTSGTGAGVPGLGEIEAAGKSGTGDVSATVKSNNAWFVAFAPASAPRYAAVVVFERVAEHGASMAGPQTARLLAEALK